MIPRIQPCLWFDGNAEEAARFYADTFPDTRIGAVQCAPGDYPDGKQARLIANPIRMPGVTLPTNAAPSMGAHTAELLREAGYTDAEITALRDKDVVAGTTTVSSHPVVAADD